MIFYFVGVSTAHSAAMRIFPSWMEELDRRDVAIEGVDCAIHDRPEVYRRIVERIKNDHETIGALVTTHKIDLLAASRELFDYLDPYAELTGEVSSISKRGGLLEGHAKDPITVGTSLDAIVPPGYFGRTGGEVLLLGAGGSATATVLHLAMVRREEDRPKRVVAVDRSGPRLDSLRAMVKRLAPPFEMQYVENSDPVRNDEIMYGMAECSVVINATGMGKDTPGSPITDAGVFPHRGIAWEFNYRGKLDFLRQARDQKRERKLQVEDGWLYFLHGWSQVVAQILHFELTPELFVRLKRRAESMSGR